MGRGQLWTEAEKAYARQLRTKRWRRKSIALALGKSECAIKGFFDRDTPAVRDPVQHVETPLSVIAERDKRANEYRTPAEILMGDPPFSQSQLARPPRGGVSERRESVTVYSLTYLDQA